MDKIGVARGDQVALRDRLLRIHSDAPISQQTLKAYDVAVDGPSSYWLLARRTGAVLQIDARVGDVVDSNKALVTIADLSELRVTVGLPLDAASSVNAGDKVRVYMADQSQPLSAEVLTVSRMPAAEEATTPVRIRVANSDGLLHPEGVVQVVFGAEDYPSSPR